MAYHLIINPAAGKGKAGQSAGALINLATETFPGIVVHQSKYAGHVREIAAGLKDGNHTLIVAGGDGSIHEAVNGLVSGNCTLAIIPIGSGNDFVKMLDLPLIPAKAFQVVKAAKTMAIDIGKAGDTCFPNSLGLGFDAEAVIVSKSVRRLRGFFIYLYSVLKTIFTYQNRPAEIKFNGEVVEQEIFMLAVGNGRCSGGGFYITPEAEINDGLFDVCLVEGLTRVKIIQHLLKVIKGTHATVKEVRMFRTNKLTVSCATGVPVHADGELVAEAATSLEIELLPGALKVIHNLASARE